MLAYRTTDRSNSDMNFSLHWPDKLTDVTRHFSFLFTRVQKILDIGHIIIALVLGPYVGGYRHDDG
jgi:hypothetical protein